MYRVTGLVTGLAKIIPRRANRFRLIGSLATRVPVANNRISRGKTGLCKYAHACQWTKCCHDCG